MNVNNNRINHRNRSFSDSVNPNQSDDKKIDESDEKHVEIIQSNNVPSLS